MLRACACLKAVWIRHIFLLAEREVFYANWIAPFITQRECLSPQIKRSWVITMNNWLIHHCLIFKGFIRLLCRQFSSYKIMPCFHLTKAKILHVQFTFKVNQMSKHDVTNNLTHLQYIESKNKNIFRFPRRSRKKAPHIYLNFPLIVRVGRRVRQPQILTQYCRWIIQVVAHAGYRRSCRNWSRHFNLWCVRERISAELTFFMIRVTVVVYHHGVVVVHRMIVRAIVAVRVRLAVVVRITRRRWT